MPAGITYMSAAMGAGTPSFQLVRQGRTIASGVSGSKVNVTACGGSYIFNVRPHRPGHADAAQIYSGSINATRS